jgi:hypothetical protein
MENETIQRIQTEKDRKERDNETLTPLKIC